jgi:hypothetical protein
MGGELLWFFNDSQIFQGLIIDKCQVFIQYSFFHPGLRNSTKLQGLGKRCLFLGRLLFTNIGYHIMLLLISEAKPKTNDTRH